MNLSYVKASSTFHGALNSFDYKGLDSYGNRVEIGVQEHYAITQTRTLRYRFYPHFHHYVSELNKRLIEQSVGGLQAADTEYISNDDGTFKTLPFSFQISLPKGLILDLPKSGQPTEFEAIILPAKVTVTLPNEVKVKLKDGLGDEATLPGSVIARESDRGTRVLLMNGSTEDLEIGAVVKLSDNIRVVLPEMIYITGSDGKLRRLTEPNFVDVLAGTSVEILGGKPLPKLFQDIFTKFKPTDMVQQPYPVCDLDFTSSGAYSVYNWELFYHIPLAIAMHLSKNQRFEEAQRWFHFIFDPTDTSDFATPERFWKVKPFQFTEVKQIEDILVNLSTGADSVLHKDTVNSIGAWKDSPFRPHLVARYRQSAYMYKSVMAYLDNLIAWGDELFRQDTGESINEATQLYVLAALILGERPQPVPKKGSLAPLTYASKRGKWDEFGNLLEQLESEIPFDLSPFPMSGGADDRFATLKSIGSSLYFCVPRNDKLMGYWDTVADRLFKIRNSLNLQGIFRQLPLFEPPIDPALLARAAAAGLDVSAIIAGVNQPLPLVRFQLLLQKATEICQEVKSLGNNLLSAIEKEDGEALAILRAKHESTILGMVNSVKYSQWQEAIKNREGLETSLYNAKQRYIYFERLLGEKESDIYNPQMLDLDAKGLAAFNFKNEEPVMYRRDYEIDISQDLGASGGKKISNHEAKELNATHSARDWQVRSSAMSTAASLSYYIPTFHGHFDFWSIGVEFEFGGKHVGPALQAIAEYQRNLSTQDSYEANMMEKVGKYARREQDWVQSVNSAAGDMDQIFKQIRAAQIRENIAKREWDNHQVQMKHSQEIENFLKNEKNEKQYKQTNQAFYAWLKREVRGMYSQVFQFAYDVAKKAERALQHELGNPDLTYLQYGYMSGKEGLLAGEKLYFDLKRMEMAYHELNKREYELTKNISLLQVNPLALIALRTTGRCTIQLPESLFDMDAPGHYFRRIKSVAISIPCVTGPYTSVNCTLTLTKSSIRKEVGVGDGYARLGTEDSRFSDHYGSMQTIVTSTAQNDSGMFETNLRDERYLPFEYSGVISEWELALPSELRQFDYDTISDVILHLRYTAREGGGKLRDGAVKHLKEQIKNGQAAGSVRLFSIRHEFPTEWAKMQNQNPNVNKRFGLELSFRPEHYPFWSKGRLNSVMRMEVWARSTTENPLSPSVDIFESVDKNNNDKKGTLAEAGSLHNGLLKSGLPEKPEGALKLYFDTKSVADLWIAVTWSE